MGPLPSLIARVVLSLIFAPMFFAASSHADESDHVEDRLPSAPSKWTIAGNSKLAAALREFYARREYRPLWISGEALSVRGQALKNALARAAEHGIDPAPYRFPQAAQDGGRVVAYEPIAIELAITRVYLRFAGRLSGGGHNEAQFITSQGVKQSSAIALLKGIEKADDPAAFIQGLAPRTREYQSLEAALAEYRRIEHEGGWSVIQGGATLKRSSRGKRVEQVARRLAVTGDLRSGSSSMIFDDNLVAAVKRFQMRHGLKQSGVVDVETMTVMNVPIEERIAEIVLNLERLRRVQAKPERRYVFLNIAEGMLRVIEDGKTIHSARVIVGKPQQQTPQFSAPITQIELNPYWNVPRSIAIDELLPIVRRNPAYLTANDYLLLTRQGDNSSAIDPGSVNWATIGPENFPFSIRQLPGAKNALGSIVFRLPNSYNVYLHDTPAKQLFERNFRYSSHGCMRIEFPLRLALLILRGQDDGIWTEQRLQELIASGKQTFIEVKTPLPVQIAYLTAWAESDGTMHFRRDVYNRDPGLKAALSQLAQKR